MAGLAQPGGRGGVEVHVAYEQLLAKLRGAGDRLAGVVDHAGMTVEHELVLTAHEPAEGDAGEVVAGALGEHALALGALAGVVGEAEMLTIRGRARQRLVGGRGPGSQMSSHTVSPMRCSPRSITAPAGPAWK